jgi:transcriptional regulator with XRE-family HTH domain
MPSIGEQIRNARVAHGLSLEDIATATHINRKFLEDIEFDRPSNLPPTYTRAFIRAYAAMVDLDPDELLPRPVAEQPSAQSAAPLPNDSPTPSQQFQRTEKRGAPLQQQQSKGLLIVSTFIITGLIATILLIQFHRRSAPVQEVPFPETSQLPQTSQNAAAHDSAAGNVQTRPPVTHDSLMLEAVATDTVWLRLLIDSSSTREYTLPPRHRMKWKAVNSFLVSFNNAGGIFFTLNGVHLGALGPGAGPMKNILLNRDVLVRMKKPAAKKPPNEKH